MLSRAMPVRRRRPSRKEKLSLEEDDEGFEDFSFFASMSLDGSEGLRRREVLLADILTKSMSKDRLAYL